MFFFYSHISRSDGDAAALVDEHMQSGGTKFNSPSHSLSKLTVLKSISELRCLVELMHK